MFYSQQGQDRKLEKFVFKGYKNGVFVDAYFTNLLSICKL